MNEVTLQARKDFSRIGLSLFAIGICTVVLQFFLSFLWTVTTAGTPLQTSEWALWLLTYAPMYLIAMPVGVWMMRKVPVEDHPGQKLDIKRFGILMLICMPIMYGGNIIGTVLSSLLSGGTAQNALVELIMENPVSTMVTAVLIAPFLEEYIFRKQIIDRLGKYGELTAILFSALTFGLFHMNLFQFFYAFGLGLIFAYVYTRTRMLRYPVIMHMIINFLGSVVAPLLLNVLDMDVLTAIESGEATMEQIIPALPGLLAYLGYSGLLLICVVAGAVLLSLRWNKRILLPSSQELPVGSGFKVSWCNVGTILFSVLCFIMIVISLISGLL